MRALALLATVVVICTAAASAQAAARPNTQFDGTYHLLAPAFPPHLNVDCPAQNGVPAVHLSPAIPAAARNVHVLGGVYAGAHVEGTGTIGHIWLHSNIAVAGSNATLTTTISFNSTFHSMSVAVHVLGKTPQCAISGGYIQTGHRIGP